MRNYHFDLKSVKPAADFLASMDCELVATDHDVFDYVNILENAPLIIDTRGQYRQVFGNVAKA